jgi:hypothetical protein
MPREREGRGEEEGGYPDPWGGGARGKVPVGEGLCRPEMSMMAAVAAPRGMASV